MKRLFTNLFLVALVIAPGALFSQNCRNIVKYCDHAKRDGFLRNGQSLSGAFAQGDTAEITVIVYKNMEYRMSLCSPTHDELDGQFEFKIVEKITKPYWDEKKVSNVEEVAKLDENGDKSYIKHNTRTFAEKMNKKKDIRSFKQDPRDEIPF